MGNVFYGRKNYKRAISFYRKSFKYAENKSVILANIALAYDHIKNKGRARWYSQKALAAINREKSFYKDKRLKNELIAMLKGV